MLLAQACAAQFTSGFKLSPTAYYSPFVSFRKFSDDYNKVNEPYLKKELGNLSLMTGYTCTFSFTINGLYSSLNYDRLHSETRAIFNNGNKRIFDFTTKVISTDIGYFYHSPKNEICLAAGLGAVTNVMRAYRKFEDGTVSYTGAGLLSGEYQNIGVLFTIQGGYTRIISKRLGLFAQGKMFFAKGEILNTSLISHQGDLELKLVQDQPVKSDIKGYGLTVGINIRLINYEE